MQRLNPRIIPIIGLSLIFLFSATIGNRAIAQTKEHDDLTKALANPEAVIILNLRYQGITELPAEIGKLINLQKLYLAGNDLSTLPPEIGNLQKLEEIYLEDNFINHLPAEIGNLSSLHTLAMPYNEITDLPSEFSNLKNLKSFDLRNNPVPATRQAEIRNAIPFAQISFNDNELLNAQPYLLSKEQLSRVKIFHSVEDALKNPAEVFALNLSDKRLYSVPVDILKLKNLQRLDLSKNRLSEIPEELSQLVNLQELNLRNNKLTTLPKSLVALQNLNILKIGMNEYSEIPPVVFNFKALEYIDLSFNFSISELPGQIGNLQNLEELNLYSAGIATIAPEIGNLQNLASLNLHNNRLTNLPKEFANCNKLGVLILSKNEDLDILETGDILSNCRSLEQLDLRENNISNRKRKKIREKLPDTMVLY